ncbi:WD40 repeat-like protein [Agyrium rufum]|nr:WD40 repeat-like protein [Agyrium rufum]
MSIKAAAIWAPAPATTRGQPTQLSSDPKGERIAYANNKSIFLRSIDNPSVSTQYTGHTTNTTVARFSPSGYYVASGDSTGTVKVWDCVGEGTTKGTYPIIGGAISDIAWDGDSQRIIAVGNGKERFGHCITADSGNSVGEISGHTSQINTVSIRQQRPLRAATGSDDSNTVFYHGAPFKFETMLREQHQKSIYGVAFSPDGSLLVSVGADRKIWLYDGKTGAAKTSVGADEHKGSIFAVSWSKDSKSFVTSSADQTVKIWDAEAGKVSQSWRLGAEGVVNPLDHQVGVVWPVGRSDGLIISLNLAGDLTYLTKGTDKPQRVVQGHQKNITAATTSGSTGSSETLWTGSSEGRIYSWDTTTGVAEIANGESHSNYVSSLASSQSSRVSSVGWDDTLRTIDSSTKTFIGGVTKTDGQPSAVATTPDGKVTIVATHKAIEVFDDSSKVSSTPTKYSASALAVSNSSIAIGGDDSTLHIHPLPSSASSSSALKESKSISLPGPQITTLAWQGQSTSAQYLAVGFSNGKISVFDTSSWEVAISRWSSHTGRITSIEWNAEGTHAVSGSLDTNVFVWSVEKPGRRISVQNAHKDGVNGVGWLGKGKIYSVGGDAAVKIWDVAFS